MVFNCYQANAFFSAVPENSENESDALLHFTAEFSTRYVLSIVLRGLCFSMMWKILAFFFTGQSPLCVCCRYGECNPVFFIGTLEAASQEAFYGKARDVSNNTGACLGSMIYRTCMILYDRFQWLFIFYMLGRFLK